MRLFNRKYINANYIFKKKQNKTITGLFTIYTCIRKINANKNVVVKSSKNFKPLTQHKL